MQRSVRTIVAKGSQSIHRCAKQRTALFTTSFSTYNQSIKQAIQQHHGSSPKHHKHVDQNVLIFNNSNTTNSTTINTSSTTASNNAQNVKIDEDANEKDCRVLFDKVMEELSKEYNGDKALKFPKEIIFLLGAPGSGKGTMTNFIQQSRGLTAAPLVVSDILAGTEFEEIKAKGGLVGDGIVLKYLFKALLRAENETGVIVDGFPRTQLQANALSLLFDWMQEQREKYGREFRRPKFRITVLYIPEEISIYRQLARGKYALENNERVKQTGIGELLEVRPSDLSEEVARERYRYFKENLWSSVKLLKPKFNYNFIDASGPKEQVAENLRAEMKYQSSLELGKETFDMISIIPTSTTLTRHARQLLVKRLDYYAIEHSELFAKVLEVLKNEFLKIMERQALTGTSIIRTQNPILSDKVAIDMILDILLERGYNVVLDQEREFRPMTVDLTTGQIHGEVTKIYHFTISHETPKIRN